LDREDTALTRSPRSNGSLTLTTATPNAQKLARMSSHISGHKNLKNSTSSIFGCFFDVLSVLLESRVTGDLCL
jgi:hypothetical protein